MGTNGMDSPSRCWPGGTRPTPTPDCCPIASLTHRAFPLYFSTLNVPVFEFHAPGKGIHAGVQRQPRNPNHHRNPRAGDCGNQQLGDIAPHPVIPILPAARTVRRKSRTRNLNKPKTETEPCKEIE